MAALRRDMIAAPAIDHLRESWTDVGQSETRIEGGTFALDTQTRNRASTSIPRPDQVLWARKP